MTAVREKETNIFIGFTIVIVECSLKSSCEVKWFEHKEFENN